MKKIVFSLTYIILFVVGIHAQQTDTPALIIGINVEELNSVYLSKFWSSMSKGGFRKMVSGGAYFPNTSYPYYYCDAACDMATIATASTPFLNRVGCSDVFDRKKGQMSLLVEDATVSGINDTRKFSAARIQTSTLTDEVYNSTIGLSKVVSIAIDPMHAIIGAGHVGAAYWMNNLTGEWASSSYYINSLPDWVKSRNGSLLNSYLSKTWQPKFPVSLYITAPLTKTDFSYEINSVCGTGTALYSNFATTPFANEYVCDMAIAAIDGEKLGKDLNTDMLMLTFSLKPFFKKADAGLCAELEDAYLRLDMTIKRLIETAETKVGKGRVLVYLTTTRSNSNRTDFISSKIPSNSFSIERYRALLNSYLMAAFGKKKWVVAAGKGNIYLDRKLIEDNNLSLCDVQKKAKEFFYLIPGVAHLATSCELDELCFGLDSDIKLPYNREFSGDLMYTLSPNWYEIGAKDKSTGYAANYSQNVPFFLYGWHIKPNQYNEITDIRDIISTISSWVGASMPSGSRGCKVDINCQE